MDLSTNYMGLELKNPIIVGSSKLTSTYAGVKQCADQGAGAIVLKSLFEEQLIIDSEKLMDQDMQYYWYPEAVDYINNFAKAGGLDEYVALIKKIKADLNIPVIASINCVSANEWPQFAKKIEEAGADALELNIAIFPFKHEVESAEIENRYVEIVKEVKKYVSIPVAVKLCSGFTNLCKISKDLVEAGADALVLFNRYYRPDIDINTQKVVHNNFYSAPQEITHSMRWVNILSQRIKGDISASNGIHDAKGVIKQILSGADTTQMVSAIYNKGTAYIETVLQDLEKWMKKNNYNSLADFKGKLAKEDESTAAFYRVQFMKRTVE
jgi:dihydroorotate dehydrogenase (fumarate)